jgi:chromosome segregation ATPase
MLFNMENFKMSTLQVPARVAKHEAAENRLIELRAKAQEIHDNIRAKNGERSRAGANAGDIDRRVLHLLSEQETIAEEIAQARREISSLRARHAKRVRDGLAAPSQAAACRARAALGELTQALAALNEIDETLVTNHGEGLFLLAPDFSGLSERLSRIAEGT